MLRLYISGFSDLIYPSNLDEIGGGHSIQFSILRDNPINYSKEIADVIDSSTNVLNNLASGTDTGASFSGAIGAVSSVATSASNFVGGSRYVSSISANKQTAEVVGNIYLYMPDTVNVNQSSDWQDTSLTQLFGKFGFAAQTAKSIFDSKAGGGDTFLSNAKNYISSNPQLAPNAIEGLGLLTNQQEIANYALSLGGVAINPQLEVLYKGVGLRTFQFDFTFTPRNAKESQTVNDIIKTFRKYSSPQLVTDNGPSRYFKVPHKFQITYLFNGNRNGFVNKFAECVLETVNIDYATRGWSTYVDGSPVQTRMVLQFKEIVIIDQDKIDEGY